MLIGSSFRPCVYALLSDKRQASYEYVLNIIKERLPLASLVFISMDFEITAKSAVNTVFSEAVVNGYNFHFGQALWRRLQHLGHASLYQSDKTFVFRCKHFLSLAFVPPNGKLALFFKFIYFFLDIERALSLIDLSVQFARPMDPFIQYLRENYVGSADR